MGALLRGLSSRFGAVSHGLQLLTCYVHDHGRTGGAAEPAHTADREQLVSSRPTRRFWVGLRCSAEPRRPLAAADAQSLDGSTGEARHTTEMEHTMPQTAIFGPPKDMAVPPKGGPASPAAQRRSARRHEDAMV